MKRCPHWSPAQNKRFRMVRIDGPGGFLGDKPGYQHDAEKGTLTRNRYGFHGHELLRLAKPNEIPADFKLIDD